MSDMNSNGSVNNRALLDEIRSVRTGVDDLRDRLGRMEGSFATFADNCSGHRAGVDRDLRALEERRDVKLLEDRMTEIERRWLPVLTSLRAKLIFIPSVVLFVLAAGVHLWRVLGWIASHIPVTPTMGP
jgi:hypothetical protein